MSVAVSGFLSNDGKFYFTEDEADYYNHLRDLYQAFNKVISAAEEVNVDAVQKQQLFTYALAFIKEQSPVITKLLACHERLSNSNEVAGSADTGVETVRERVRGEDFEEVAGLATPEDIAQRVSEESGGEPLEEATGPVEETSWSPITHPDRRAKKNA